MSDTGICGSTDTESGDPCQIPEYLCQWHGDGTPDNGRPAAFDDEWRREALYEAARLGMHLYHQAGFAQVCENTIRRALCCIETPTKPILTTDDPCDFCKGYVRAHSEGAKETLQNCSSEYVASATFDYNKTEEREIDAEHEHTVASIPSDDQLDDLLVDLDEWE